MLYLGSLAGVYSIQSLSASPSNQIAVIPQVQLDAVGPQALADTFVNLFSASLNPLGQLSTTPFVVGGTPYPSHGRWIFYSANATQLFIVTQADASAALQTDYAVETIGLTNPNSCSATFATTSAAAPANGGLATTQISSGEHCLFTATSNASWLALSSGYFGSGDTTLTYLVRPNLTSTVRSGTISIGSQTLTITQAAAGPASDQNLLSFNPIAADYSKALDRVVMASSAPNELHLYDPLTQNDQIISLPYAPTSVSVGPDGLSAGVGYDGHFSYVNLQTQTVSTPIPVDLTVSGVILAGNGYAYVFSNSNAPSYSIQLSTNNSLPYWRLDQVRGLRSRPIHLPHRRIGPLS